MGTDITMLVEGRYKSRYGWTPLTGAKMWPDEVKRQFGRTPVLLRNYELFSVLADVRNRTGRGTKEMRTLVDPTSGREFEWEYDIDDGGHDPLIPIAEPKGIPDDASDIWTGWLNSAEQMLHGGVYHDHSFLTLAELRTGQWDQIVYRQAVLTEEEYAALIERNEKPMQLARGAGGEGVRTVNEVEYAAGVRGEDSTVISARWKEGPLSGLISTFNVMMRAMEAAATEVLGGPDNIRILFAFDS